MRWRHSHKSTWSYDAEFWWSTLDGFSLSRVGFLVFILRENRPPSSAVLFSLFLAMAEVDADVEPAVIPVGLVIAAPLAVVVHALYVSVHLSAVLAVSGRILIDPGAICIEPLAATPAPVLIRPSWSPHGQQQTSGQRGD